MCRTIGLLFSEIEYQYRERLTVSKLAGSAYRIRATNCMLSIRDPGDGAGFVLTAKLNSPKRTDGTPLMQAVSVTLLYLSTSACRCINS